MMPIARCRFQIRRIAAPAAVVAAALACATWPAVAADGHAAPSKPQAEPRAGVAKGKAGADPAGAAVAAPRPLAKGDGVAERPARPMPAPPDPMAALREKLAQKLGAGKPAESANANVMQVTARGAGDTQRQAAVPAAHVKSTAAKPSTGQGGHTAGLVARLRAEKAASGHVAGAHLSAHWGYAGAGSPDQWAMLRPEYAKCGNGTRQSPIDIRSAVKVDLEPIQFDYRASGFSVIDNGHTVQVNLASGNSIEVMGRRYDLLQFHFHRPSEERIDGRQFDMSAHLVHRDPEGRLAVVGVLLDRGSVHPLVQTVWNNLPLEKGEELRAQVLLDPGHLLPADRRYYTYMGSLTTPPCTEGVLWMVMQQPVPISPEQVAVFSRLHPMNARPVQSAAGRLIKGSN
jgi:carbonic anhydrase